MQEGQGYGEPSSGPPEPMAGPAQPPVAPKSNVAVPALVIAVIALAIALIGMVAFPGPTGPEGAQGVEGSQGDDGDRGPTGLPGSQGQTGAGGAGGTNGTDGLDGTDGTNGTDGLDGMDGITCWDLNGNGVGDLPAEDINGDLAVDILDCTGAQGPIGPQGPPGPPATVLWAVVELDGTLARGSGVGSSTKQGGNGFYVVRFIQDVRACVWIATLGASGASGTPAPGSITTVGEAADPTGVWISTYDVAGTSTDRSFHLTVTC